MIQRKIQKHSGLANRGKKLNVTSDGKANNNEKRIVYAVDFDGTLCSNKYPGVGEPNIRLMKFLIKQRLDGNLVILWTCREKDILAAAIEYCRGFGLEFDAVNENVPYLKERYGNDTRKIGADIYIDDKSLDRSVFSLPYKGGCDGKN